MKVIDNFLPKQIFNFYKEFLLSNKFPWFYYDSVSHQQDTNDFFYIHGFYKDNQQKSEFFNHLVMPILGRLDFNYLIRAKANLYTRKHKEIISDFHVDSEEKHNVALFSINTNNGYTLFKSGEKYYSKENTLLLFDGSLYHASVPQTDEKIRVNININIQ